MSISLEEVNRIAKLARLKFTDEEKQKLQHELSAILDYIDQLKQIEGKITETTPDPDGVNLMRDDIVEEFTDPKEFLKQAPALEGNFIKVKSVME